MAGHFGWNRRHDEHPNGICRYAFFKLAIANYSSLPNAILGCRFFAKAKDGSWTPLSIYPSWDNISSVEFPLNVPSMQTVSLQVWLEQKMPPGDEETGWLKNLSTPLELKVEMTALGERKFTQLLTQPESSR